jgi:hypothetical protein
VFGNFVFPLISGISRFPVIQKRFYFGLSYDNQISGTNTAAVVLVTPLVVEKAMIKYLSE